MYRLLYFGILLIGGWVGPQVCAQSDQHGGQDQGLSVSSTKEGIQIAENGRPVLHYQTHPKSLGGEHRRANYLHPVYDLRGNVLTEDFPSDHRHHRGIFWAWHQLTCDGKPAGDGWMAEDFDWDVKAHRAELTKRGTVQITAEVQWRSSLIVDQQGQSIPLINESTRIDVHPVAEDRRMIDFDIRLLAARPNIRLGGSDDVKGYGGFSVRVEQPDDIAFQTSKGIVNAKTTPMNCGNWVDIVGTFGKASKPSGVAILVHPSSAGFPQKWILRSTAKSMQNPVFPGRQPILVSQTDPIVLRYRIVLHRELFDVAELNAAYADYSTSGSD